MVSFKGTLLAACRYSHFFPPKPSHVDYSLGLGTNAKDKFISLWTLIYLADYKKIKKLQIMGDSKLIIVWVERKVIIQAPCLEHIFMHINNELGRLESYSIKHIY